MGGGARGSAPEGVRRKHACYARAANVGSACEVQSRTSAQRDMEKLRYCLCAVMYCPETWTALTRPAPLHGTSRGSDACYGTFLWNGLSASPSACDRVSCRVKRKRKK